MAFLDTVNTITRKTIVPGMVDLVFKSGPTMAYIKRNCHAARRSRVCGGGDLTVYAPPEFVPSHRLKLCPWTVSTASTCSGYR